MSLNGAEMLIKNVLKMMGVKPEDILGPLAQIRDTVVGADKRLAQVESDLAAIKAHFNIGDKQHEFDGTEQRQRIGVNGSGQ